MNFFLSDLSGVEVKIGFQDVAFLLYLVSFTQHFLGIVAGVKVYGEPHVLKLWLGVGKAMLKNCGGG